MVRLAAPARACWGHGTTLALHGVLPFKPGPPARLAVCARPACLSSAGLHASLTQLPCQQGSACPALRFVASCAAGQATDESPSTAGAPPEPPFLCRAALWALPRQGQRARGRQALERGSPGLGCRLGGGSREVQVPPELQQPQPQGEAAARYLEVQDDGPDQAEGQLGVAVGNVIVPDVHQLHLQARSPQWCPQGGWAGAGLWGRDGASPGGAAGSPGRSARSAACGSASSPFLGAVREASASGQRRSPAALRTPEPRSSPTWSPSLSCLRSPPPTSCKGGHGPRGQAQWGLGRPAARPRLREGRKGLGRRQ